MSKLAIPAPGHNLDVVGLEDKRNDLPIESCIARLIPPEENIDEQSWGQIRS
ncbi:hypothetical protein [Ferrimicrobium sp.]|uniref:hypothetical protein n=1 Tax=Ferrimicrobium sp. TaxID=2926050 RepID=UPI0026226F41|nr:hypothetical protein [Ferrimicrobium sp.]